MLHSIVGNLLIFNWLIKIGYASGSQTCTYNIYLNLYGHQN